MAGLRVLFCQCFCCVLLRVLHRGVALCYNGCMSKPVRIREFVALQVEELAAAERRSFANTVETLLLDALEAGRSTERTREVVAAAAEVVSPGVQTEVVRSRPHMKRGRPAVECPTRWPAGVCPDCGQVIDG